MESSYEIIDIKKKEVCNIRFREILLSFTSRKKKVKRIYTTLRTQLSNKHTRSIKYPYALSYPSSHIPPVRRPRDNT